MAKPQTKKRVGARATGKTVRRNARRFLDYADASREAHKLANESGLDVAIRKAKEFGKTGYNVGYASKNDSDYATAEIVRPAAANHRNPGGAAKAYQAAYKKAEAAEATFQAALVKEYKGRAGDMRYQTAKQTPAIRAKGAAYSKAMDAMKAALDKMRAAGESLNPGGVYFSVSARGGKYPSYYGSQTEAEKAAKAQSLDQASEVTVHRTEGGRSKSVAMVRGGKVHPTNPGSFARCVAAVSRKGVDDPGAVCAASKMRRPGGKAELLSAAQMGKNPAHVATLKQGKAQALVHQTGAHSFTVSITKPGGNERESFKTVKGAMGWARLRLHEVANPQGVRVKVYPLGALAKIRKNPLDAATKMFEEFHGYPSEEVLEYVEQEHRHSVLAGIGPLISFTVMNVHGNRVVPILAPNPGEAKLDKIVQLTVTEDGRQLELVGGDQALDVKALQGDFGMNEHDVRDRMLIGTIMQLEYRTRKTFEAEGEEVVDFYHDLGEEHSEGILPVLIYKPRNPSLEIAGGRYFIGKPEGGEIGRGSSLGRVSPGIVG